MATACEKLAAFAVGRQDFTDLAIRIGLLSLVDWIAVGRLGVEEPVSQCVQLYGDKSGGAAVASVFGRANRFPPQVSALINGTISHALDYDDTHFLHIGHPSVVIASAALSVAQAVNATGAEFLSAYLVGVEASCRIGDWLGREHYALGFHQTATSGAFGAALASARLLGLGRPAMEHVLGLTATRAAGLKSQFGTMGKPLNAGFAAAAGVECATLVSLGVTSNTAALEAGQGFGPTHAGEAREQAFAELGRSWVLTDISHKFHACCHGTHAALEALRLLRGDLSLDRIDRVQIETNPRWLTVCDVAEPTTGLEAKFSYRFTAAMMLGGADTAKVSNFSDHACEDPDLRSLAQRIRAVGHPELADTEARVTIFMKDATSVSARHDIASPLPVSEREARMRKKTESLLGIEVSDAVWRCVGKLAAAPSLENFAAQIAGTH